jgi:hypothetical protein
MAALPKMVNVLPAREQKNGIRESHPFSQVNVSDPAAIQARLPRIDDQRPTTT